MKDFRFHHFVKDKNGYIEMELWYADGKWGVHYPQYEGQETSLRRPTCFAEFRTDQVAMLIFAYDKDEFLRFEKEFLAASREWVNQNIIKHGLEDGDK